MCSRVGKHGGGMIFKVFFAGKLVLHRFDLIEGREFFCIVL
jgi:hypothetical protein